MKTDKAREQEIETWTISCEEMECQVYGIETQDTEVVRKSDHLLAVEQLEQTLKAEIEARNIAYNEWQESLTAAEAKIKAQEEEIEKFNKVKKEIYQTLSVHHKELCIDSTSAYSAIFRSITESEKENQNG